jgi:molybdate/tungstate transport system substrate-binding protein
MAMALALGLAACGNGPAPSGPGGGGGGPETASVAYAGSLLYLAEKVLGPGFAAATGDKFSGRGAGSLALSQEIASGEIAPNVFMSIGGKPIEALEPRFTSWYVQFAASPLVVAYSTTGRFAPQLEAIAAGREPLADLFTLMSMPGFLLGRTDPNVDPQGQAFVEMLQLAKMKYRLAPGSVERILDGPPSASTSSEIYDETALEPRLEAGQLDAASAYLSQAVQLHLHYIDLGPALDFADPALASTYAKASFPLSSGKVVHGQPLAVDITVIGSSDAQAADRFVAFVLSSQGLDDFSHNGYTVLPPTAYGDRSAIPSDVAVELGP